MVIFSPAALQGIGHGDRSSRSRPSILLGFVDGLVARLGIDEVMTTKNQN
jgi:hypothetical protein